MDNIVLIGMPGAGKSTLGVVLAKAMGYKFIDSDILIQEEEGKLLSQILEESGPDVFNQIEERINSSIDVNHSVIATGGSVIYGPKAMEHLRSIGVVVYIKLPCQTIKKRIGDFEERGINMDNGQTIEDLYEERVPLYEKYAHITVETAGMELNKSMDLIRKKVRQYLEEKATC